jgi:hypothetical protein
MNHDGELLHRCADGVASPDEQAALAARLRDDAELRGRYLDLMNLDTALSAAGDAAEITAIEATSSVRRGWLNPFATAAAGLVLGLFAATAVWAVASGKSPRAVKVALADAGFESGSALSLGGVPDRPGRWAADLNEVVERHGKAVPREGAHMLRFLGASTEGNHVGGKFSGSDLYQVVALPGNGTRTVRIRAWFNADTEKEAWFHVAAVAGAGTSADGKELWEQRNVEGAALAFARTMTSVDHDPATWEAGELTLQVPPKARVLVIGIAAFRLRGGPVGEWFPAQFVDDVSVSITEEVQP